MTKTETSFPETTERFIAYFDIMGFKDMVYRSDHSEVLKIMNFVSTFVAVIKDLENESLKKDERDRTGDYENKVVLPVLFSDSVLFVSESNSISDVFKIISSASFFMQKMFMKQIPVKGALAYGTFTANFNTSKFFGRPLVDAYLLAEETYFYGALLHHSFDKYLSENKWLIANYLVRKGLVPMKSGNVTHIFIDWRTNLRKEGLRWESIFQPFYLSVSGNTRKCVDNSFDIYRKNPYQYRKEDKPEHNQDIQDPSTS